MTPPAPAAARFLERALLFTIVIHAVAMLSMALILLPGQPGANPDAAGRIAYVAKHPWLWRLGWFPWQLTALSDLLIALALIRTAWIPRGPAWMSLLLTITAVGIEQPGEILWMTDGVHLAREAMQTGIHTEYLEFEAATFRQVSLWAATFYTLAAIVWSVSFARARTWSRGLTILSAVAWGLMLFVTLAPALLKADGPSQSVIAAGNALGFILMMAWFVWVAELVLRRSRPDSAYGRMAPWRAPKGGPFGATLNVIANSRFLRNCGELIPSPPIVSDIVNVIYVNYLVPVERVNGLLPPYLELQRLGPDGRYTLLTFLTYTHGHLGPRFFGPMRRLLPSPVQSNWRIHVRDPQTDIRGIYFFSTAISNPLHAVAARLLSEGVPMHLLRQAEVTARPDGSFLVHLDPGIGSAPDVHAELRPASVPDLMGPWRDCFRGWHDFLAFCVPQDRAMSSQPWYARVTRQEIRLDIPLDACEPLAGTVSSRAAAAIVGDAIPLCFRVPSVYFRLDREEYDRRRLK